MIQTIASAADRLEVLAAKQAGGSLRKPATMRDKRCPVLPGLVWLGLLAGTPVVAYAYAQAATVFQGQAHYHLFWLGMLLFMVPAFLRLCGTDVPRAERLALIAAVGLYECLPKFLRSPQQPLFFDELA